MNLFSKIISVLVLLLLISCSKDKKPKMLIDETQRKNDGKLNHVVNKDVARVLRTFSESETIALVKTPKDTTIIKNENSKLLFINDALKTIITPKVKYEIEDEETISLTFNIGDQQKRGQLKKGIYSGDYIIFDNQGYYELAFNNKGDTLSVYGAYNDGGKRKSIKYLKNKKNGTLLEYHPNALKAKEVFYEDGNISGTYREWFDNGRLKTKANYLNGAKEGEEIINHKHVNLMASRRNYSNGQLNGLQVAWYDNNRPKYKVNFKKGKLNGEFLIYHEDTNSLYIKGNYIEDYRDGDFTIWNKKSNSIFSANYEQGQLIEIIKGSEESESILVKNESEFF